MAKIDLEDIKGNSFKSKEAAEGRTPNPIGSVKMKNKPVSRKFKEAIFSNETGDVKSYLMFGIVIPAIKNTIVNVGKSALELVFGVDGTSTYGVTQKKKNTPYYQYYSSEVDMIKKPSSTKLSNSYNKYAYKELNCTSYACATEIRDILLEALSKYNRVSVGDLYDTVQEVCQNSSLVSSETTDYKWGWKNLANSYIKREFDGTYTLILPDPIYLD